MECLCNNEVAELSSACIGQLWVFENLQMPEKEAIVKSAFRKAYKRGEVVFTHGDAADKIFLIKAGKVKLTKVTETGNEIILDIRKEGDFLGEQTLAEHFDYPLTATCIDDAFVCGFTKNIFEKLVLDFPNIGLQVIKNLSKRVDLLTCRTETLTFASIEERLYGVLMNISKEHGIRDKRGILVTIPLTHEELSFLAGAHRVSITRAIKGLKKAGKLTQKGKSLILITGS